MQQSKQHTFQVSDRNKIPLASIGLPVYNGANYLALAIRSILTQSLTDFELIIFDNASTDATESICRRFALEDSRVIYHRNYKNHGAAKNYDLCFEKAKGEFFRWAAHDDMLETSYLEETVKAMRQDPGAIKCATAIREVDENGETIRIYNQKYLKGNQDKAYQRFLSMIKHRHNCVDFFALYRRESLINSQLHGNYVSSDRVLIAEMALRGRTIRLDQALFVHRQHSNRYAKLILPNRAEAILWWNPDGANKISGKFQRLTAFINLFRTVNRSSPTIKDSLICYLCIFFWPYWNYIKPKPDDRGLEN